jgi:hypothetical protein
MLPMSGVLPVRASVRWRVGPPEYQTCCQSRRSWAVSLRGFGVTSHWIAGSEDSTPGSPSAACAA